MSSLNASVFKSLYQHISDAVVVVDEAFQIVYNNNLFAEYYAVKGEIAFSGTLKIAMENLFNKGIGCEKLLFTANSKEFIVKLSMFEAFEKPYLISTSKIANGTKHELKVNESLARSSSELISPSLSIDTIARIVFKACIDLTNSETGFVAFDDPMSEKILLHYFTESYIDGKELSANIKFIDRDDYLQKGLYGRNMNANTPEFKNDLNIEVKRKIGKRNPEIIKNYLTYPAIVNNIFMGQIVLVNCPGGFTDEHIKIISSLSNVYGLAIFRKRMEWDLVSAKEKAEESDRLKTAFLANMSHEIRTPMNAIVGFSQLITSVELNSIKRDEFAKLIQGSCEDLLKLVTEIIDLSKIEAKQLVLYHQPFNLENVLYQQVELTRIKAASLAKSLIIEFDSQNPEFSITTDQSRLVQIMRNLLDNALKFTDQGSIRVYYKLIDKNHIEITVKDSGIGIPYENQNRVFESFRQLEIAMKRNYGGTGLGLSMVKNLTELMGGKIELQSNPGCGSEFIVILPIHQYKNKAKESISPSTRVGSIRGKNILIVEDEPRNAKFLELLLTGEKAKTKTMYNGKQAVEWVKRNSPDLILMDVRMPVMDGIEATEKIREILPEVPIIAQTAYAMKEDEILCLDAGCSAFISKPINKDSLMQLINDQLF